MKKIRAKVIDYVHIQSVIFIGCLWVFYFFGSSLCALAVQDREFVELEIAYNGQPKRTGSPSPMASPAHSTNSAVGLMQSCCGRCCSQRYQACGKYMPASGNAQNSQNNQPMDGTYLVEASF